MIREVRQRELKLLIQALQPASGKAKIWARVWAWAVGLLSLYFIDPPNVKKVYCVCLRESHSLEKRHSPQGCAVTCHRHQENKSGRVCSTRGRGRELGKLPGGSDLYPLSRAHSFSSKLVSLGEEKAFPVDGGTSAEAGRYGLAGV